MSHVRHTGGHWSMCTSIVQYSDKLWFVMKFSTSPFSPWVILSQPMALLGTYNSQFWFLPWVSPLFSRLSHVFLVFMVGKYFMVFRLCSSSVGESFEGSTRNCTSLNLQHLRPYLSNSSLESFVVWTDESTHTLPSEDEAECLALRSLFTDWFLNVGKSLV